MNSIWQNFKELSTSAFESLGLAWWVEIITENPRCTYYFGPFLSSTEAKSYIDGYVEDLEQEGAEGITVNVKRCKPTVLTIADDLVEDYDLGKWNDPKVKPIFSGQM